MGLAVDTDSAVGFDNEQAVAARTAIRVAAMPVILPRLPTFKLVLVISRSPSRETCSAAT
jgi:hypothetical protein